MEERGLAPSTIDRRLSTVCGYYRFAHIDGRITSNPAQYARRPRVHPTTQRGMDRGELAAFLYTAERISPMHAAVAVLLGLNGLRVSEACGTDIEDLGFERGHRTLRIIGKGNKPATIPLVPRTGRTRDLAIGERSEPASTTCIRTCSERRSSWPHSTPASHCATFRLPPATPTHGRPRSMTGVGRTSTVTLPTPWSPSSPAADTIRQIASANDSASRPRSPGVGGSSRSRDDAASALRRPGTGAALEPRHPGVASSVRTVADSPFVPSDFEPPTALVSDDFRLEPLAPPAQRCRPRGVDV